MAQDDGFLSRWSRRKAQVADTAVPPAAVEPHPAANRRPGTPGPAAAQPARDAALAPKAAPSPALSGPQTASTRSALVPTQSPASAGPDDPEAPPAPPPPTLEEAQQLTPEADFTRFVGRDVDPQVKNAALKNLFSDPQFNIMDGLDIYIDDYGKPDPLPAGMLERMTQSVALGLFRKTPEEEAAALAKAQTERPIPADPADPAAPAAAAPADTPEAGIATVNEHAPETASAPAPHTPTDPQPPNPDENPDLRLQRHDDAGRPGPGQGAEPDPGGQR